MFVALDFGMEPVTSVHDVYLGVLLLDTVAACYRVCEVIFLFVTDTDSVERKSHVSKRRHIIEHNIS